MAAKAVMAATLGLFLAAVGGRSANAQQPAPSLMFTPAEVAAMLKALTPSTETGEASPDAQAAEPGTVAPRVPNVFVSAVADFGDGQWTVWANGYRIAPDRQPPGFHVVSVQDNMVEIVVSGEQAAHFRLRPYQTWRAGHPDIVEGIVP